MSLKSIAKPIAKMPVPAKPKTPKTLQPTKSFHATAVLKIIGKKHS